MFWVARLTRLLRPMPPTPTPAMFSVSLGGVKPRPSTWRGTIANPAVPADTFLKNVRRDTPSPCFAMDAPPMLILPAHTVKRHNHEDTKARRTTDRTLRVFVTSWLLLRSVSGQEFGVDRYFRINGFT